MSIVQQQQSNNKKGRFIKTKYSLTYPIMYISTPKQIRRLMVTFLPENLDSKILDAGCGSGEFLEILHEKGYRRVTGIEICTYLAEEAKRRFPCYTIINGDFLQHNSYYDAIISNPPYILGKKIDDPILRESIKKITGSLMGNLCHAFIYHSVELLRDGGRMVFLIPKSFLRVSSAENVRKFLAERGIVEYIIDFGKNRVFDDVYSALIIMVFTKVGSK